MSCASDRGGRELDVKESGSALDELVLGHDVVTAFGSRITLPKSTAPPSCSLEIQRRESRRQGASSFLYLLLSV